MKRGGAQTWSPLSWKSPGEANLKPEPTWLLLGPQKIEIQAQVLSRLAGAKWAVKTLAIIPSNL